MSNNDRLTNFTISINIFKLLAAKYLPSPTAKYPRQFAASSRSLAFVCALLSKRNMVDASDAFDIGQSLSSTSIASEPDDVDVSGNGRIVDEPINEIPFIAADMRSDCCSDRRFPGIWIPDCL